MLKTAIIFGAALGLLHGVATPAYSRPYVNVETNSGFVGNDYTGTLIETHVGYESDLGKASSWYIQGGPAFLTVDQGSSIQAASGKVGVSTALTSNLTAYGELYTMTADNYNFDSLNVTVKSGLKYTF